MSEGTIAASSAEELNQNNQNDKGKRKIDRIDGLLLREMLAAGSSVLESNKDSVDALNVFPVPDGDTGTNMSMTIVTAVREVSAREINHAGEAAEAIAKGALRGARGNSGVILSQLLRGFARGVAGHKQITARIFADGLKAGSETAYKAVMKPKEGTILTVARIMADAACLQAERAPDDLECLFEVILKAGEAILKKTPDMLPALKQAGVIDAGGRGLLHIYYGMRAALLGQAIEPLHTTKHDDGKAVFEDDHDALAEITFAYCTEFFVTHILETVTDDDIQVFKRRLNRIGDSIIVVGDTNLIKVHVHTNDPGRALQAGQQLGELYGLKIENMLEQRRERVAREEEEERKKTSFGIVAVSQGEGFTKIFHDLNVQCIVEGGQTMNPSIEDLVKAIECVKARCVFILPNNGNVILAAQQACELFSQNGKEAYVVPTKNVAMGIAAAVAIEESASAQDNINAMTEAAQLVTTGMVTRAIRDSRFGELEIKLGDAIGLLNGEIAKAGDSEEDVALALAKILLAERPDALVTLYWGGEATEETSRALLDLIQDAHPGCDC
ncbi:MAG: DAK2 domain-containing protein, partial [Oscillospiraceae bacterium]|nr:DAK2 domain-containing protein [Oscillospiraceae bacterium]